MHSWTADRLGERYQQREIPLGDDPDAENPIMATLVRHQEFPPGAKVSQAVIAVHGFTDYFFHTHVAEFFISRGIAFYALDLRKCGRSLRAGHTPHYVSDLSFYDAELGEAVRLVQSDLPHAHIAFLAHSTGGLTVPLWLDRMNLRPGGVEALGINGVMLNSPWFDLHADLLMRTVGTQALRPLARIMPKRIMPLGISDAYGHSLHESTGGEWAYDTQLKPLNGFRVTYGWLNAIRRGHAALHQGLNIGVPSLVLRSHRSHFSANTEPLTHVSDAVLDVDQIAKWTGCLGGAVTSLPIREAKHDVFLSRPEPRAAAFRAVGDWLDRTLGV